MEKSKRRNNYEKRVLALLLATTMVFGLTACGGGSDAPAADDAQTEDSTDAASGENTEAALQL